MDKQVITAEIPVLAAPKKLARIEVLDVLRGFALLGIFLMNIEYFNRSFFDFGMGIPAGTQGLDYTVARATELWVTGKFWILFSMLFGMGFVVMQTQARLDASAFRQIYLRRTAALLAFGLLHIVFLWPGDILHSYALIGFVLMWLPVASARLSILLGAALYFGIGAMTLFSSLMFRFMPEKELKKIAADSGDVVAQAAEASQIYMHGDYWQITQQRLVDFLQVLYYEPIILIAAFGIFLLGAGIMRSGKLLDLPANRSFYLKLAISNICLATFFLLLANAFHGHSAMTSNGMLEQGFMMFANLPLALFYFGTIAYAMSFVGCAKILGVLAPAGKMALTNYLMQSLIASTVFFGYGLGFWNQWGRADLAIFVLVVFIAQVIFSHLWLRYFRYGPMEWLWRALTYWSLPPMRVDANHAVI